MIISLIGFMGSGKTTVGKLLANELNYQFIDLDILIEKKSKRSISELISISEDHFREIEKEVLKEVLESSDHSLILSTGGGTPCHFNNMDVLNEHSVSIYLKTYTKILANRLYFEKNKRPLISEVSDLEALIQKTKRLLRKRSKYYNRATYTVSGNKRPKMVVNEIKRLISVKQ